MWVGVSSAKCWAVGALSTAISSFNCAFTDSANSTRIYEKSFGLHLTPKSLKFYLSKKFEIYIERYEWIIHTCAISWDKMPLKWPKWTPPENTHKGQSRSQSPSPGESSEVSSRWGCETNTFFHLEIRVGSGQFEANFKSTKLTGIEKSYTVCRFLALQIPSNSDHLLRLVLPVFLIRVFFLSLFRLALPVVAPSNSNCGRCHSPLSPVLYTYSTSFIFFLIALCMHTGWVQGALVFKVGAKSPISMATAFHLLIRIPHKWVPTTA